MTKSRPKRNSKQFAIAIAALTCAASLATVVSANLRAAGLTARAELPRLMLWAWERPEDLRGADPRTAGVAFLARTLYLSGDNVGVRPRLQPLRVAAGTPLVAVVRIETTLGKTPTYSAHQRSLSVDAISNAAQIPADCAAYKSTSTPESPNANSTAPCSSTYESESRPTYR